MHRRQLLARVATTGLVLVGVQRGGAMSLSAAEVSIVLRARDEASATIRQAEASAASLAQSFERSLERYAQALLAYQRDRDMYHSRGVRGGRNPVGPPYIVGEEGPELFTPYLSAGKPRTDIDYESMANAIARAIQQMPPPRVVR